MVTKKTDKPKNPIANNKVKFFTLSTKVDTNKNGEVFVDVKDVKLIKYDNGRFGLSASVGKEPNKVNLSTFISSSVADEIQGKYGKTAVAHVKK